MNPQKLQRYTEQELVDLMSLISQELKRRYSIESSNTSPDVERSLDRPFGLLSSLFKKNIRTYNTLVHYMNQKPNVTKPITMRDVLNLSLSEMRQIKGFGKASETLICTALVDYCDTNGINYMAYPLFRYTTE